jgi:class 3 adenylate cyclase
VEIEDVRYVRSGDVAIAYQVVGEGPVDIVFVRGFAGDLLSVWEQPLMARFIRELASFARVLLVDKRGTGLSDRVSKVPTLETRRDDLRAVLDREGSKRAILWTAQEGARLAALFAATDPERVAGLVLFIPSAKSRPTPDYPWAPDERAWQRQLADIGERWGTTEYLDERLADWAPTKRDDPQFRAWFHAHMRRGLSPGSALAFYRTMREADVSEILPAVRVPTVVLATPSELAPSTYVAERIPGARLVELPNDCGIYHWVDAAASEIAMRETRALAGVAAGAVASDRVLATVLFTDIVDSTDQAARLGDQAWRDLLARHDALIRRRLGEFDGRMVDSAGDGIFATFEGPARAIRCAEAIVRSARESGLELRAGLHSGECEVHGTKLAGIAVHTGARVAGQAGPAEVLVSQTVKDLVAGSGIEFDDRGIHQLKGVPGEWRLYAVAGT